MTICYLRVSSRNGRQRTDSQKLALRRSIRSSGFKSVKWYEDKASGGKATGSTPTASQTFVDNSRNPDSLHGTKLLGWKGH